jgi:hypothetical protein
MKRICYLACAVLILLGCGAENDQITSSSTIDELTTASATLIADGVSQMTVTAMVLDSLGYPAEDQKVFFRTSAGTITRSGRTNTSGLVAVVLTSAASATDISVVVSATVLDSSALQKSVPFSGTLQLMLGQATVPAKLAKNASSGTDAQADVLFLGVAFTAQVERNTIPADGSSTTKLDVVVRETTSGKAVQNAHITLRSKKLTVANELITTDRGTAQTLISAPSLACVDTLALDYGLFNTRTIWLTFVQTRLSLLPEKNRLLADGKSSLILTARLITHDNNPVVGATIRFSSQHGVISGSAATNDRGEALATLTSTDKVISASRVIASFNGVMDTAYVDYVASTAVRMEMQIDNRLYRDGLSTLPCIVSLYDNNQKPVANSSIRFKTTLGAIDSLASTDEDGTALVAFTADGGEGDATAVITATHAALTITASVQLRGVQINVTAEPDSIIADGRSTSLITVHVKGSSNHEAIAGVGLAMSTSLGAIVNRIVTDASGLARTNLTAGATQGVAQVQVKYAELSKIIPVHFLGSVAQKLVLQSLSGSSYLRDGVTMQNLRVQLLDNHSKSVSGATVRLTSVYGTVLDSLVHTDDNGLATIRYLPDCGAVDVQEIITASCDDVKAVLTVNLLGLNLTLAVSPDSLPADGSSTAQVTAQLRYTTSNAVISDRVISFSATLGSIPTAAATNLLGNAVTSFTAATTPGQAIIVARYGALSKSVPVRLVADVAMTVVLSSSPAYIWVKETGNLDQTILTAVVLSASGKPLGNETLVRFILRNGPGGGEILAPATAHSNLETSAIRTVDGAAQATLQSGTISGTVEVQAELVAYPAIKSNKSNVTIRSGPPYIWIDPTDKSHVISHMTLALDVFNVEGWNHVRKINASVYVGDKYNNPVEQGTNIYLTGTAGIVTTDLATDAMGEGSVTWSTANPRPYVEPNDATAWAPHRIPTPNAPGQFLPIIVPDFEGGLVMNQSGSVGENDGIAYLMASTHGKDQDGKDAIVYAMNSAVFSGPLYFFEVKTDKTVLKLGEAALISIRVFDLNGNPMARGSSLSAATSAGKVSNTSLMASADRYGYGTTSFTIYLLNNLDPLEQLATTAEVTIKLDSPNGTGTRTVFIDLLLER